MVEIMKKKFDQDLFLNLWCDPLGYFAKMNSTLGSVVPLAMFPPYKQFPVTFPLAGTRRSTFHQIQVSGRRSPTAPSWSTTRGGSCTAGSTKYFFLENSSIYFLRLERLHQVLGCGFSPRWAPVNSLRWAFIGKDLFLSILKNHKKGP